MSMRHWFATAPSTRCPARGLESPLWNGARDPRRESEFPLIAGDNGKRCELFSDGTFKPE